LVKLLRAEESPPFVTVAIEKSAVTYGHLADLQATLTEYG
jgi:hypothetical protein